MRKKKVEEEENKDDDEEEEEEEKADEEKEDEEDREYVLRLYFCFFISVKKNGKARETYNEPVFSYEISEELLSMPLIIIVLVYTKYNIYKYCFIIIMIKRNRYLLC
jgi:hypothetical protein